MCEYCGCQSVAAMAELAALIATVLGPHTAVEEQGLFPPLADEFPDHITGLVAEHRQIEGVLAGAPHGRSAPAARAHPGRAGRVFPAALARLDTPDWAALDAVRDRVGTLVPSEPATAAPQFEK